MTFRKTVKGRNVSLLGYGAMRMPTLDGGHANGWNKEGYSEALIDQTTLDVQIKYLLVHGVNYFDTSPAYCRGESEERLGAALEASGFARDDYVLATKLSNFAPQQFPLDECKKMFEKSLKYLRTDYIDNYLLHSIGNGGFETFSKRYLENGALDWCASLREEKRIRNLGFSYHGDPKALDWCLDHHGDYKWDFCQIQMNYIDWRHAKEVNDRNLDAKYLYERLTDLKIPVVIMEPLLGGRLARHNYALAKELGPLEPGASLASWAFRFCGTFPNVLTVLSGMTKMAHVVENVTTFSPLRPCGDKELEALERAARAFLALHTIPCTSCSYCMPCPFGLDIPSIFSFRNDVITREKTLSTREALELYEQTVPEKLRRAERCTGCDRCKSHCPQNIDISKELGAIDKWVDEMIDEEVGK